MYKIMLFKNVSSVLKAEKLLKSQHIPHKLIPVPKLISSECGMCLKYEAIHETRILQAITDRVDFEDIAEINLI